MCANDECRPERVLQVRDWLIARRTLGLLMAAMWLLLTVNLQPKIPSAQRALSRVFYSFSKPLDNRF